MKIKLGIIGLGVISRFQRKAIEYLSDKYEITAICDIDSSKLEKFYDELQNRNIRLYRYVSEMVNDNSVDTVLVSTPPATHKEIVIASVKAGKSVLLEKPAALSYYEVNEMFETAKSNNSFLHIAYHSSFAADLEWYLDNRKTLIKQYDLGKLRKAECVFCDPYMKDGVILAEKRGLGGSWIDSGVNELSVCERLFDLSKFRLAEKTHKTEKNSPFMNCSSCCKYASQECELILKTAWDADINKKTTLLAFDNTDIQILLDHSEQEVILITPDGEKTLYQNSEQERLVKQYIGVFSDFADSYAQNCGNLQKSKVIHNLLFDGC